MITSALFIAPENHLSDKMYWHGYIPFYEKFLLARSFRNIAEFGVFKGDSIRWLLERFPDSSVYGADILPVQSEWPVNPRFHFTQMNQESIKEIRSFLGQCKFDLIIEDGSHRPKHQVNCLIEGMDVLAPQGIYILEDIHTSMPGHSMGKKIHWWKFEEKRQYKSLKSKQPPGNALHTLLGLDHFKRIGVEVSDDIASSIATNSMLTKAEILKLASQIDSIHLYRRPHLPDFCYNCGAAMYDFSKLKCVCGTPIFSDADSMSFVILKK